MADAPMTNGTAAPTAPSTPSAAPSAPATKSASPGASAGAIPTGPQTPAPATPPPTPREKFVLKFKDGDKDMEWDEDMIRRNVQIGLRADKRMADAARKDKEIAAREAALTGKDPVAILKAHGLDPEGFAYSYTEEALKRQTLTPEQQELLETKRERDELKRKYEEREQQERQTREQQQQSAAEKEIETSYLGALEEFGFKPQSDPKHRDVELGLIVPLMATEEDYLTRNGLPVNAKDLAARVEGRLDTLISHRITSLPADKLYAKLEKMKPGIFNELARHALNLRRAPQEPVTPATLPPVASNLKPTSEMTPEERLEESRSAFGESRWRVRG